MPELSQVHNTQESLCYVNGFFWTPRYTQQGKQVLVNNSGSVIFSACWFIFSLEPSVPRKRHFRSWASGRGRSNRPPCQGVGSPQGPEQPVIQASRCSCTKGEGGRKSEGHSRPFQLPGESSRGHMPPRRRHPPGSLSFSNRKEKRSQRGRIRDNSAVSQS